MNVDFLSQFSWGIFGTIILVDLLLSVDNAVVIAMAAKELPAAKRKQAILLGSGAAIIMRFVLTAFAAQLLLFPYLKIIGGLLLLYIATDLLVDSEDVHEHKPPHTLTQAIRTIMIADFVMSLDNVVAVAAAAKGSNLMLIIGLALSIPFIVFGSTYLMKFMDRFPVIVIFGAALLGWLSGGMFVNDPVVLAYFGHVSHMTAIIIQVLSALLVILIARLRKGKPLPWARTYSN